MHHFWPTLIKPLLDLLSPRRLIEIGAGDGRNSRQIARWASSCQAHCDLVDPAPSFDLEGLAARHPGRVVAHRRRSLDVLDRLLPADVVLIDGDHNWYTVYHELMTIYGGAASLPEQAPVVLCHDVGWPYGRRDLYYDPASIPEAHRQPCRVGAVRPDATGIARLGLNPGFCHAEQEGGPRNGVRTAIEDALQGRTEAFRTVWIPIFHGLAILVPKPWLERHRELGAWLDRLEPGPALRGLYQRAEYERCLGNIDRLFLQGLRSDAQPTGDNTAGRPFTTSLPDGLVKTIQQGTLEYRYKGLKMVLNPFDLANYLALLDKLRPATIFEIGVYEGGRSLWLADNLAALGIDAQIIAVDLAPPADLGNDRVRCLTGNARHLADVLTAAELEALPHPFLVIEDSAHDLETCAQVLDFFHGYLRSGDYIVVEDGILHSLMEPDAAEPALAPPSLAVAGFLETHGSDYAIDTESCDRFGFNATFQPNGWLRRR